MIHILVVIIGVVCWLWGRVYETKHKIKDTPLTTFIANPRSFLSKHILWLEFKGYRRSGKTCRSRNSDYEGKWQDKYCEIY